MTSSGNNKKFIAAALWALSAAGIAAIAVFFRFYPLTFYPEYAARNKAEVLIYSGLRKSIDNLIDTKAAGMPVAAREELKKTAFKKYLVDGKAKIDSMIGQTAQKFYQETKARHLPPYLMEVDPYYYLSLTRRLLDKNAVARPIRGREYFNEMMLAPKGAWYPIDYHPYTGLAVYKILSVIRHGIPLPTALGYVPLFLAVLCGVLFLTVVRRAFSVGGAAAFVGAAFLVLSPVYLRRSLWGWFDTDSYNVLFPLLILWGLFIFLQEKPSRKKTALLFLPGIATAVYSLFWRGWLLEHALICGGLILAALFTRSAKRGVKKENLSYAVLYFILTPVLATFCLWGLPGLKELLGEAAELTKSFYLPTFDLWPDAFLTVGELRRSTPASLVQSLGGVISLAVLFIGVFPALKKNTRSEPDGACLLLTAFFFLLAAALGAGIERFALLAVVPAAFGVACGAERLFQWTRKIKLFSPSSVRNFLFATLTGWILWQGHLTAQFEHPIYNATWDRMMTRIRETTPPDSILTSWWCPGHYLTSFGGRRVTFDGATQNTPQIYWVANLFLQDSEYKAAGILRMLDLSANDAVDFLTGTGKMKLSEAVAFLHGILPLDRKEALESAEKILEKKDAEALVSLTHGTHTPPPGYVFIYNDMVDQVMALEYTGKRDFAKAEAFQKRLLEAPQLRKKLLNRNSTDHVILTWQLAEGPYAQDTESFEAAHSGDTVYFTNGLALDVKTMDARLISEKFGKGIPRSVLFLKDGHLEKKSLENAGLKISALIIRDESVLPDGRLITAYRSVLGDERLLESLIFRLYYLKGEGLTRFSLVASEEDPADRTKLYLYRVNWS